MRCSVSINVSFFIPFFPSLLWRASPIWNIQFPKYTTTHAHNASSVYFRFFFLWFFVVFFFIDFCFSVRFSFRFVLLLPFIGLPLYSKRIFRSIYFFFIVGSKVLCLYECVCALCACTSTTYAFHFCVKRFFASEVSSWVMRKCYDNLFYYVSVIWSTHTQNLRNKFPIYVALSRPLSPYLPFVPRFYFLFRFRHMCGGTVCVYAVTVNGIGVVCIHWHWQCDSNVIVRSSVKFDFSFTIYFYFACCWW